VVGLEGCTPHYDWNNLAKKLEGIIIYVFVLSKNVMVLFVFLILLCFILFTPLPTFKLHSIPNITLVDNKDRFVFSPLLYELATGRADDAEVAPFFSDLLQGTTIKHVRGCVQSIDLDSRCVRVASVPLDPQQLKMSLEYDNLVIALGSESSQTSDIKGVKELCLQFYTVSLFM
jgi:demethylphylloquinone reductase